MPIVDRYIIIQGAFGVINFLALKKAIIIGRRKVSSLASFVLPLV